jgi:hypothetical protein
MENNMKIKRLFKFVTEHYISFEQQEIDNYRNKNEYTKSLSDEEIADRLYDIRMSKSGSLSNMKWYTFEIK